VEEVLQRLARPESKYEKLYNYTTSQSPQRLVLKPQYRRRPAPLTSDTTTKTTITTADEVRIDHHAIDKVQDNNPTTATATSSSSSTTTTESMATPTTTSGVLESLQKNRQNRPKTVITDNPDDYQDRLKEVLQQPPPSEDSAKEEEDTYSEDDGHSIDTRVYIMKLASSQTTDPILATNLRNILMAYPHALDHIATCIHLFNFDTTTTTTPPSSSPSASTNDHDERYTNDSSHNDAHGMDTKEKSMKM
jgi:hypothetical protein